MERQNTETEKTERERKRRAAAKKEERKKKGKGGEDKTLFSLVFVLWDLFSRLRGAACRWRVARWGGGKNPRKITHVRFRFSFLLFPDETKKNSKLKQVQRVLNQFVIKASDIPAGLGLDLTRCEFHWEDYFEDALDNIAKLKHEDPAAFAAAFPAADRVGSVFRMQGFNGGKNETGEPFCTIEIIGEAELPEPPAGPAKVSSPNSRGAPNSSFFSHFFFCFL